MRQCHGGDYILLHLEEVGVYDYLLDEGGGRLNEPAKNSARHGVLVDPHQLLLVGDVGEVEAQLHPDQRRRNTTSRLDGAVCIMVAVAVDSGVDQLPELVDD